MTPAENQARLVAGLAAIPDPLERLNTLASRARSLPPVPEPERVEAFLVRAGAANIGIQIRRYVTAGPGA